MAFQNDETNLVNQVRNQDKIIQFLKLRLKESESQIEEYLRVVKAQVTIKAVYIAIGMVEISIF